MHVLLLTETWPPDRGGMAESCDRIVGGLRRRGVRLDAGVFSRRRDQPVVERQEHGRLLLCPVDEDSGHTIQRLWNLLTLDREQLDRLTHVMAFGGLLPLLAAPAIAAWIDRPLVTLLRGNDFDLGLFTPRRAEALRDAVLRSARVCTVSRDHQRKLTRLFPSAPVVWTPNGIDLAAWRLTDADRRSARAWRDASVGPGRRVLGLMGHLKQKKGGPFFVDVLRRSGLAARVHLLMVGEVEAALPALLDQSRDAIAYTIVPPVDRWQLPPYYAACDVVVIPSFYDGLPNVLLEAGAFGLPVVASTAGGIADVVDDDSAFTFHPGDLHSCRRAIDRAVGADEAHLRRLGERLRARVERNFTAALEIERYLDVLRDVGDAATRRASVPSNPRLAETGHPH